jgi:DNA-binding transcriptional LysR family regulator
MTFDNTETIKRAVEINSGITILPETVIKQEVASGTLKGIRFLNENFVRPTGIIVRKNKIRSKACSYLIDLLQNKSK